MRLTDTLDEQAVLEELVEEVKPAVPPGCEKLHFLLHTPFRYAPYPRGSRFRRAFQKQGAFYASEQLRTALAELAFHRVLFFAAAPGAELPRTPADLTAIRVFCRASLAIDLTTPPLSKQEQAWTDLTDYSSCQDIADAARAAGIQAIRYRSVRAPDGGTNVVIIDPQAFGRSSPAETQTWQMLMTRRSVRVFREMPAQERYEFDIDEFARDPRLSGAI